MPSGLSKFFGNANWYSHYLADLEDEHQFEASTLARVLMPFEESLRSIDTHLKGLEPAKDDDDEDRIQSIVDDEVEYIEEMLGATFVICQRFLTRGVSAAMRLHDYVAHQRQAPLACCGNNKSSLMKCSSKLIAAGTATEVEVLNAFANYFKHRDEWSTSWSKLDRQSAATAAVLSAAGASDHGTGNFRAGSRELGNPDFWRIQIFVGQLASWRHDLAQLHRAELVARGLIAK